MHFASKQDYLSRKHVGEAFSDASKIVRVDGGWMVFDTETDYRSWKAQR